MGMALCRNRCRLFFVRKDGLTSSAQAPASVALAINSGIAR